MSLEDLTFLGQGLKRPECVLCTADGSVFAADWEGGVTRIAPDGRQARHLAEGEGWVRPNGIALRRDGSFLLAHLGEDSGGVFSLDRNGTLRPVLTEVEGSPLPPTNFVLEDEYGRLWITVSTRLRPRIRGCRADAADGFIVLSDDRGARIVADGLGYTNEVQFDAEGRHLYVNETFGRRLSRFRAAPDGTLSDYEIVAEFGPGTFPDGLAFDAEGAIWIVSIVSNRVIRVQPDGRQEVVLEDSDAAHLDWVEAAYAAGRLTRAHLDRIESRRLRNISSLAFGGPDLKTVYLGCLLGDSLARFPAPVAGRPPLHWEVAA
ncbi:MAG: SMP-30/gluconolactonase/LRE family protein [Kiloniellales bacterium]|nr:SMP-30/gluconolactonase/LRE family protein [Kiloniellales bacterium]